MQHQNLNPEEEDLHRSTAPSRPFDGSGGEARIEDYLDHVCAPLVGTVPYERRLELRSEVRCHLQTLIEAFEELGSPYNEAVDSALRQFGDPALIGREWQTQWQSHRPAEPFSLRALRPTYLRGLACFIPALLFMWLYVAVDSRGPSLSVPEAQFFALVLPAALGAAIGWFTPGRRPLGTALSILTLVLVVRAFIEPIPFEETRGRYHEMMLILPAICWMTVASAATSIAGKMRDRLTTPRSPWVTR
jgi:hypothetical protein